MVVNVTRDANKGIYIVMRYKLMSYPVNMPLVASTGPVPVIFWQHWPSTGPVLAHNGMFMGIGGSGISSTQVC